MPKNKYDIIYGKQIILSIIQIVRILRFLVLGVNSIKIGP
jgi:hypothetical protein